MARAGDGVVNERDESSTTRISRAVLKDNVGVDGEDDGPSGTL